MSRETVVLKWINYLAAMSGVLLVIQFAGAGRAYAMSDYDNLIQNTSDLKLTYSGHSDLDISSNYMSYFKNAITNSNIVYTCRADGIDTADPTNCNTIIDSSLEYGDWIITASPEYNFNYIGAVFCDQKITSVTGKTNAYPDGSNNKYLVGNTSVPANCVTISMRLLDMMDGTHPTVSAQVYSNVTDNVMTVASSFNNSIGTTYTQYEYLFTSTAPFPEGYVGNYPSSEYIPPTPTTTLYTGTIDCGGEMPVAMSMYQPDNIGAADLTELSPGRAQWSYNLTSDPYSFTVDCGDGKLATPYGAVDPASSSNDWVCDIISTEPYHCALS